MVLKNNFIGAYIMKKLNKITLIASLIAMAAASNAATSTSKLTITAYNPSQCTVGFSNPNINLKMDGTTLNGATTNLEFSCSMNSSAKIFISSASGNTLSTQFRLINPEYPNDGGIPYSFTLGTLAGTDVANWEFNAEFGISATSNLATIAGIDQNHVIRTKATMTATNAGKTAYAPVTVTTLQKAAPNPGQYSDVITATMVY